MHSVIIVNCHLLFILLYIFIHYFIYIMENNEKLNLDAALYISPEEWTGGQF